MQFVNEFDYEYAYNMFLIEEEYNEAMFKFQTDTLLLNEANIGTLLTNLKLFIEKIVEGIKTVAQKFKETMTDLFMKDKDYLRKYNNIVKDKPVLKATFKQYYAYDVDKIKTSKLPKLNIDQLLKCNGDEKEAIKVLFPSFVSVSSDQSFQDRVKEVFRGGEAKTVNAQDVNIESLFKFCKSYDSLIAQMEKDAYAIDEADLITKARFKLNKISAATPVYKQKSNESFDYAKTMEYYFNEVNIESDEKDKEANARTVANNSDSDDIMVKDNTDVKSAEELEQEKKEAEATKLYYKICAQFLGMRFAMASECYKQYMKIIKWHVSQYNSDKSKEKKEKANKKKNKKKNTGNTENNNQSSEQNSDSSNNDNENKK